MGKVRFNDNTEIVAAVKEGLKRKDGYCPCRLEKIPENKCCLLYTSPSPRD